MKHFKIIVVVALMISLIINVRVLSKMGDLENRVNSISNSQIDIKRSVDHQSSHFNNTLQEFKREQSWISAIGTDIDTEKLDNGQPTIHFNWQVKELLRDSEVNFHYKFGEDEHYERVPAVDVGDGLFEASISVDIPLEPQWFTNVSRSRAKSANEMEVELMVEEKARYDIHKNQLYYYVTVSNEELVKSDDIKTTDLGYLGTRYYGVLESMVDFHGDGYNISVIAPPLYDDKGITLQEVSVMKYNNGVLVAEDNLELSESNTNTGPEQPLRFQKNFNDDQFEFTSLVFKVVYNNGATFEREVYIE
ncbi:hypothetical protein BKP35_05205 [Anaerobacillus arseniciselenatis]|uniref:Uncharacterized protein n=1 Tax=Anaerobacillus arseniciselenatis TaxID=85682 RepID=A0A1S2LUA2_9BACI|nr:hypothetical protein [Anaerobacillus arseniciselenatis]OIJ15247.1 hypothetical protein BKP35_05205 [Anaerobacillus arseniciselenatis]